MFKFLKEERLLTPISLHEKTEYFIDRFLAKENITMWYSPENQGKTWFSFAVAKHILQNYNVKMLLYMDMDNGKANLADRNVEQIFEKHKNFKFIHRSTIDITPHDLLIEIGEEAYGRNYKDCVFIFDATRDFVDGDMHNDTKARRMMEVMKNIREAGGTVILNHHSTKNGKSIDGSGEFGKSLDNLYRLKQHSRTDGIINYNLTVEKERAAIAHTAFSVRIKDFSLGEIDPVIASMNQEDDEFVQSVLSELGKWPDGRNQTELLTALGFKKTDKSVRRKLDGFTSLFWKMSEGSNRQKIYKAI